MAPKSDDRIVRSPEASTDSEQESPVEAHQPPAKRESAPSGSYSASSGSSEEEEEKPPQQKKASESEHEDASEERERKKRKKAEERSAELSQQLSQKLQKKNHETAKPKSGKAKPRKSQDATSSKSPVPRNQTTKDIPFGSSDWAVDPDTGYWRWNRPFIEECQFLTVSRARKG